MPSVFTRIIRGELPCYKVFEDEHTIAFLAMHAIQLGHTLVVPKVEIDYFIDVPEPYYSQVFINSKKIAAAIHLATQCKRVGTMIQGMEVPHFHHHLVPLFDAGDLNFSRARERTTQDMQMIREKIIAHL